MENPKEEAASTGSKAENVGEGDCYDPAVSGTKDSDFWYDDGTVTLVSQNVHFRVYKGLLAEHSPVFRDMFSLPQPVEAEFHLTSIGGSCPVVHVSDSPYDLRHVLRKYMPKRGTNFYVAKAPTFYSISACIRLGHKYQMTELYEQSLEYLKDFYTNNFSRWDAHESWCPPGFKNTEAIGVVNLARFTEEWTILPTALYTCARLKSAIVDGFEREDGSNEALTKSDLALCFAAKDRITEAVLGARLRTVAVTTAAQCKSVSACKAALVTATGRITAKLEQVLSADIIITLDIDVPFAQLGLCALCLTLVRTRDLAQRMEVWNRLPEIMGVTVPGWGHTAKEGS